MPNTDAFTSDFNIKTDIIDGHIIEQTVDQLMNDAIVHTATEIIDLKDKQVHDALVSLGWTPPTQTSIIL